MRLDHLLSKELFGCRPLGSPCGESLRSLLLNPGGDHVWIIVCLVAWLYVVWQGLFGFVAVLGVWSSMLLLWALDGGAVVLVCAVVAVSGVVLFENCIVDASIFFILCNFCRVIFLF